MLNWSQKNFNRGEAAKETFLKNFLNVQPFEERKSKKLYPKKPANRDVFEKRLEDLLSPSLSAKELIENIVRAALEVEFGSTFTLSRGFDKMTGAIADAVVTNPELRRQALAIASLYISKKDAQSN
ncbi:MAG: hypothetical protein KKB81_07500 [Candidatus Margulisbacteria bacterium]|nr:hypothetical protein [Candidatus Margulisiibacteriota bacterium]MBU1021196.1 hypothetical protein [Candidatus Margulisiibacteriota bacterium]MBU1729802.1 hypothetical protein [Candidatus Margulisiibacteriota bacterium]MBU1955303.1 hypothetical protein [Candidatus Margulisiibacteriota bacterium]